MSAKKTTVDAAKLAKMFKVNVVVHSPGQTQTFSKEGTVETAAAKVDKPKKIILKPASAKKVVAKKKKKLLKK